MDQTAISEALRSAWRHQQTGRPRAAEDLCRQVLLVQADHPGAIQLLGEILSRQGQTDQAIALFCRLVDLVPHHPAAHNSLGSALGRAGRFDEAAAAFRRVIALTPQRAEPHRNLGKALADMGDADGAVTAWRRALALNGDDAATWEALGHLLNQQQKHAEAADAFGHVVRVQPGNAAAHVNLGIALARSARKLEGLNAFQTAVRLDPGSADAHWNLGILLNDLGEVNQAFDAFARASALRPDLPEPHFNLGSALWRRGRLDEAANELRTAIALKPDYVDALVNLGNVLGHMGEIEASLDCFRRALAIRPNDPDAMSALAFALHYDVNAEPAALREASLRCAVPRIQAYRHLVQPHDNEPTPGRRLRVGYVSGDFRKHSVARFLKPLFQHHDRAAFEIYCYSEVRSPDDTTAWFRQHAEQWRSTVGLSDAQVAQLVRQDRVDILVDLAMHTHDNRLGVFACKPAPVQVTYLAYASGTGFETIDYRLSDPYLDPPEQGEGAYVEETVRLTGTYWCFEADDAAPDPGPLPAQTAGYVTFGCLNNFAKINRHVLAVWARLLAQVPGSRLTIHAREGAHRQRVLEFLAGQGVAPERIGFVGRLPFLDFLRLYEHIDIALDPFPYNGGTTTCDALWMGVPVVSLAGRTGVGRAGLSILSHAGLPELVARDVDGYVSLAAGLAGNLAHLADLRATLRPRLRSSRLTDAAGFARGVEAAFRAMWERYCTQRSPLATIPEI